LHTTTSLEASQKHILINLIHFLGISDSVKMPYLIMRFLGELVKQSVKSDYWFHHVSPYVCLSSWSYSATSRLILLKFVIFTKV